MFPFFASFNCSFFCFFLTIKSRLCTFRIVSNTLLSSWFFSYSYFYSPRSRQRLLGWVSIVYTLPVYWFTPTLFVSIFTHRFYSRQPLLVAVLRESVCVCVCIWLPFICKSCPINGKCNCVLPVSKCEIP